MAANNSLNITSVNFDVIVDNLKTYLRNQSEFRDYDFESSAMSTLINILAYNTYYNAFYLSMAASEQFLDSAQLRTNVVSKAKMLGYMPRSARGATAQLQATIVPDDSPTVITIAKNTEFQTSIDDTTYTFVAPQHYTVNTNSSGVFSTNIEIVEGIPLTHRWTVDGSTDQKFIIPNPQVDTTSITVNIQQSVSNTATTTYTLANDLTQVTGNSTVYFLEETYDSLHQIIFGDNVTGKKPVSGNIVITNYRVCNGDVTNGANTFTRSGTLGGYGDYTLTLISRASGGSNPETIESIKFNAPRNYQTQNRAVVAEDYKRLIVQNFPNIQTINVWGGENNTPPVYGKVFVAAKPFNSIYLSDSSKQEIYNFLKKRNPMSIDPEFVNPTYLFIVPTIEVQYDPNITTLTAGQINSKIQTAIINYELNSLGTFGSKFYCSQLINAVNDSDPSIISVVAQFKLQKRFITSITQSVSYNIPFNNSIAYPHSIPNSGHIAHEGQHNIYSSKFDYLTFTDCMLDDDGEGIVRIYYIDGTRRLYVNRTAGTVDYEKGIIYLNDLLFPSYRGNYINIDIIPRQRIFENRTNQLLLISNCKVSVRNSLTNTLESTVASIGTQGDTAQTFDTGIGLLVY
jgi:hypothetical protein